MQRWLFVVAVACAALVGLASGGARPAEAFVDKSFQCYWLSNDGEGWVSRPGIGNFAQCRDMDSCSEGGGGMSGGGCYKWAVGRDAPGIPWVSERRSQACYWLSNDGEGWVARPGIRTLEQCRDMDSCNEGGGGMSGGGCYKWAVARDAPGVLWVTDRRPQACYWLSNGGDGWVTRPDLRNANQCREMDSCSPEGGGRSGGGCYKWARGPNEPALPWR